MKPPKNQLTQSLGAAINWNAIEKFVGFGPSDAQCVFVGMEEGLDDDADLEADLRARSTYAPYMDLREAQIVLGGASRYVGPNAICQRTWRPMADLMLRFEGETPDRRKRNSYQGQRLGRIPGKTLLTELLPYPRKSTSYGEWEYRKFGRFESFEDYRNALLNDRVTLLRNALGSHRPRLIVCYGKKYWPDYDRLVSVERWHKRERFQYAHDGQTAVVMCWHFSQSAFNTDEQLQQFYAVVNDALARRP